MANTKLKGITIEIGGDTKGLNDALKDVEKKSKNLSKELGDINSLLKFDPGNADLLAQKQEVLGKAIAECAKKLETLKAAEKQVQEQFKKGEVSEEQVRALQREIAATEGKMKDYQKQSRGVAKALENLGEGADSAQEGFKETGTESKKAAKKVEDFGDSAKEAEDKSGKLGDTLKGAAKAGLVAVGTAVTAALTGLVAAAESTREYRTEMGKLDVAFTNSGHSAEAGQKTYKALQSVLGETDQAVEAANHLAKLATNEEDLAKWTDICTGIYGTFGASLPVEGLTEAANETAKCGTVTGSLADALNWSTMSTEGWNEALEGNKKAQKAFNRALKRGETTEDAFNAALAKCSTEQERQALITAALSGIYGDAAETYRETNAEVIRANQANEAWTSSLAGVGGAVEPIITDVKQMGAALLTDAVPGVQALATAFRGIMSGEDGAASGFGEALGALVSDLITKVTELLPTILEVGTTLVTTLVTSILEQLPNVVSALVQVVPQLITALVNLLPTLLAGLMGMTTSIISGLSAMLPSVVQAIVQIIPQLITALLENLPALLQAGVTLLMALVDAIPTVVTSLVAALPGIVTALCDFFANNAETMLTAGVTLLMALIEAIPEIVTALVENLPTIVSTIVTTIQEAGPQLLETAKTLFWSLIDAAGQLLLDLPTHITAIGTAIVDGIAAAAPNVLVAAQGIYNTIVDTITALPDKMLEIGGNLVEGLWNGINNMTDWVLEKINGFGDSVLSGIKSFFGIASPSKEMAQIGKFLDEGLAQGIANNMRDPIRAAQDMAKDVLGATEIDGPALERSLQINGSRAEAATAANSITMLDKLDKILSAIEKGQVIALDGKKLVGGTAALYDNALGQRRVLAGRGAI